MAALAQERQAEKVEGAEVGTAVHLVEAAVATPTCRAADVEVAAEAVTALGEGVASNLAVRSPLLEKTNPTSPQTTMTSRRKTQSSRK